MRPFYSVVSPLRSTAVWLALQQWQHFAAVHDAGNAQRVGAHSDANERYGSVLFMFSTAAGPRLSASQSTRALDA